jgi:hypothetical protein
MTAIEQGIAMGEMGEWVGGDGDRSETDFMHAAQKYAGLHYDLTCLPHVTCMD